MTNVLLTSLALREIEAHARATYPEECCGFLIGSATDSGHERTRTVTSVERARNTAEGPRDCRFRISADELGELERRMDLGRQSVIGFYHSHPDRTARPSQLDQVHARTGFSYVVLPVSRAATPPPRAFELDPESLTLHEVELRIVAEPSSAAERLSQGRA